MQQSSISRITQFRCFYRFTVNLRFASAAFLAPVILSCIRYPAVPVCKKCAKMCRAKIRPLKQALSFYAKPEKWPGSSPIRQLRYYLFRPSIKCTSTTMIHGRDLDNRIDTTLYRKRFTMNKLLSCRSLRFPLIQSEQMKQLLPEVPFDNRGLFDNRFFCLFDCSCFDDEL